MYYFTALPQGETPHAGFLRALEEQGWEVIRGRIGKGNREKESDVALAVRLVLAAAGGLKRAVVVSGDGDLVPAVKAARELGCRVEVASFPEFLSRPLKEAADGVINLWEVPWERMAYRPRLPSLAAG